MEVKVAVEYKLPGSVKVNLEVGPTGLADLRHVSDQVSIFRGFT
jgi:hypothetical protein